MMTTPRVTDIIFSGPMVRALLEGRKTQTRRPAWGPWKPITDERGHRIGAFDQTRTGAFPTELRKPTKWLNMHRRFQEGGPGYRELAYVRETFAVPYIDEGNSETFYRADGEKDLSWTPSIHCPRWASRITLETAGTKVEQLQEIDDSDAFAEGISCEPIGTTPRRQFRELWNPINKKPGTRWEDNLIVVALEWQLSGIHHRNVDALLAERAV